MLTTASPLVAEAFGHAGFDFVIVDLQHGENNLGNLQAMLHAISATPAIPVVRVPANLPLYIQRALDLGAYGVIVPMVNSRGDAEAMVDSVRYAPAGRRSWGPIRGALYGGTDYFAHAHEELLVVAMLETAEGLANVAEIMSVPGIDACFVGPNDLAIALGFAPEMAVLPPAVEAAIRQIIDVTAGCGKAPGIQVFDAAAGRARQAQGVRFLSIESDLRMARGTAVELLRAVRS
jgi:4-hydroxy-2-oxoheptanedioate aldolase